MGIILCCSVFLHDSMLVGFIGEQWSKFQTILELQQVLNWPEPKHFLEA
jgi:hypothetical protein